MWPSKHYRRGLVASGTTLIKLAPERVSRHLGKWGFHLMIGMILIPPQQWWQVTSWIHTYWSTTFILIIYLFQYIGCGWIKTVLRCGLLNIAMENSQYMAQQTSNLPQEELPDILESRAFNLMLGTISVPSQQWWYQCDTVNTDIHIAILPCRRGLTVSETTHVKLAPETVAKQLE